MDLTNLRQHHEELVNHMKNSGYSMSCIYMYKRQIREIMDFVSGHLPIFCEHLLKSKRPKVETLSNWQH